jgi:hypothetical protein
MSRPSPGQPGDQRGCCEGSHTAAEHRNQPVVLPNAAQQNPQGSDLGYGQIHEHHPASQDLLAQGDMSDQGQDTGQ